MKIILTGKHPSLERMFWQVAERHVNKRKSKEPKGKASDGEYCPKKKFGQSWAYIKGDKNDQDESKRVDGETKEEP